MLALAATVASLALASAVPADALPDVRWILGPAAVDLGGGRIRCMLPDGVALAAGAEASAILEAVAGAADGSELAVVSPVAPSMRWFVVLSRWSGGEADGPASATGEGSDGEPVVNRRAVVRVAGAPVLVRLVAPPTQLADAEPHFDRIVGGLRAGPTGAREARALRPSLSSPLSSRARGSSPPPSR